MITYRGLGTKGRGRFGNQLWQIAGTLGIAAQRGDVVRFPPWAYAPYFSLPPELFGAVDDDALDSPDLVHHLPGIHKFHLQDLRLWMSIESDVRRWFTFEEHVTQSIVGRFRKFIDEPTVAVHVRRGDYLYAGPDYFVALDVDYYAEAVRRLPRAHILLFSDDPDWCRQNLRGLGKPVFVMVGNSDVEDLALMTLCRHHVIANSSFSWWGAFLSGDPGVCYPDKWYGPKLDHDSAVVFPPTWVRIPA